MSGSVQRLQSLDALRGFTIIGMIIVNSPGSWSHVYGPLLHASWHGATPTDLVFPFFLFMVGVSIALAYSSKREWKQERRVAGRKVLWRVLKIFALGLFLNLWPQFDFGDMRVAGVLQRIAIVFGVCAILFLNTRWRTQLLAGVALLVGYWGALAWVPVPLDSVNEQALETGQVERSYGAVVEVDVEAAGEGALAGNFEPATNLTAWMDRALLPGSLWERTWDPEGLLSTVPSIVTGIFGMLVGSLLFAIGDPYRRVSWVMFVGFAALLVGLAWGLVFPLNKNLWSSSFVLYTGGWASLCLGACILLVDVMGYRRWTKLGLIFGSNAVTAYALSGMLVVVFYDGFGVLPNLSLWFMDTFASIGLPAKSASLLYALLYVAVIYLPIRVMWKKKIFLKL